MSRRGRHRPVLCGGGCIPSTAEGQSADADALAGYQKNPLHLEAATFVRSIVGTRLCLDYDV